MSRRAWIEHLHADEDARRKDLPDLCEWMLGTGARIGEALAVSWTRSTWRPER